MSGQGTAIRSCRSRWRELCASFRADPLFSTAASTTCQLWIEAAGGWMHEEHVRHGTNPVSTIAYTKAGVTSCWSIESLGIYGASLVMSALTSEVHAYGLGPRGTPTTICRLCYGPLGLSWAPPMQIPAQNHPAKGVAVLYELPKFYGFNPKIQRTTPGPVEQLPWPRASPAPVQGWARAFWVQMSFGALQASSLNFMLHELWDLPALFLPAL